jgi:hypothetical protein
MMPRGATERQPGRQPGGQPARRFPPRLNRWPHPASLRHQGRGIIMTTKYALIATFAALALAACTQQNGTATPYPSGGGSAGAEGPGYCDSPPSNPDDMTTWEQQCMPDRR